LRDITERRAVDKMKTEFIGMVSHELRTPLTSIRGSLGLLQGGIVGEIPPKAASLVSIALNNSDRLVRLVNDILDIEKIESGRMEFRFERHDLTEIAKEAITANTAFADQHDVRFVMDGMHENALVVADRDRITQVLTNLLSNAAKFSSTGGKVIVSVFRKGTGIQVEVADRGQGIPKDFKDRVFNKFAQADSSDNREGNGTGLGLSISKTIIEKHGGRISFRAREDLGTVFFFHLPTMVCDEVTNPTETTGSSKPRILVCEDDFDIALPPRSPRQRGSRRQGMPINTP
jgi:signal transduction histidine kinase